MRIKSLLLTALAATFLASCAKDEHLGDGGEGNSNLDPSGDNYISVAFSFAGDVSTRAGNFDKGDGAESLIDRITVYFFKDVNGTATLAGTTEAALGPENGGDGGNIEKKIDVDVPSTVVEGLLDDANSTSYSVLVVLNNGAVLQENPDISYDTFNVAQSADITTVTRQEGFMMTNSNYVKNKKEAALVPITKDHLGTKKGEQEPEAVVIPVERVAAKVTLDVTALNNRFEVLGWGLNVTNKSYFPVKKFTPGFYTAGENGEVEIMPEYADANWSKSTDWNDEPNTRSYWAVDPNYTTDAGTGKEELKQSFNYLDLSKNALSKITESLYCLENTFNHEQQRLPVTTTAVVVAQFTKDNQSGKVTKAQNGTDQTWVKWKAQNYDAATFIQRVFTEANLSQYYYKPLEATSSASEGEVAGYRQLKDTDFRIGAVDGGTSITINEQVVGYTQGATVIMKDLSDVMKGEKFYTKEAAKEGGAATISSDDIAEAIAQCFKNSEPLIYVGGYSYYEVPLTHFGDVKWNENSTPNEPKHLGRYGIVRNNSYQLKITGITQPGKPITGGEIIPDNKPDDQLDSYLKVQINVLAWKVREQEVEL